MNRINNFFWKIKSFLLAQLFTVYLRYLIGLAFIIAAIGMGKLSGTPWNNTTPIDQLHPIQQFFKVMSQSPLYWQFIGWSQIVAGLLLVTQRHAKVGALMFFGIILNIFIITVSYNFKGTPIVTGMMLLATSYLVIWDFDSIKYIFIKPSVNNLPRQISTSTDKHPFWSLLGLLLIAIVVVAMVIKIHMFFVMLSALGIGIIGLIFFMLMIKNRDERLKVAHQNLG